MVYGSASDEDLVNGKWYTVGKRETMRQCECPLPAARADARLPR
jgi:hypothetical protein